MTDEILRISGMDCGACAVRIVRALRGLPGVHAVSVSDTAGCARLTYDEAAVGLGEIARCVQRAGFDVPVETAELRCPGADDGAEARLRAVFGVRSAARAGDTFMVTLWPVGTDAAALPAVLGPGAELTAQRGGEGAQQGPDAPAAGAPVGIWRAAHGADAVAAAGARAACAGGQRCSSARAQRSGAARGACCAAGSLGPDAPGLLAALILFAYSAYATFTACGRAFPRRAASSARCWRGSTRRSWCAARFTHRCGGCGICARARRLSCGTAWGRRWTPTRSRRATWCAFCRRACPGRRRRVLRHLHSRCIRPHGAQPGRRKRRWGTQFWPARSTARAAHSSRPRRSATRRRCSGRSQPCSAHRPCAHRAPVHLAAAGVSCRVSGRWLRAG